MSSEEGDVCETPESRVEEGTMPEELKSGVNHEGNGRVVVEDSFADGDKCSDDHDELVQLVIDMKSQNEYLKSQLESMKNLQNVENVPEREEEIGSRDGESVALKELQQRVESLSKELSEEKQTRGAAEQALQHLQEAHSEADAKVHELSAKLIEAQQKLEQEIKERDEKYSDLDSKFSRLHKRAKQRIQDIQKEKDELEARFRDVNERAERATSQQTALQQEIERTRQQANEALKAIDAERQQLRSANNKLRDNIEELRHSLQPKESAIEALQQSLAEKDQMLEDMKNMLQAAEEKRQASLADLSAKHQKSLERFQMQLSDALSDRNKATETISSLQELVAEKESKIAEMDAASSGEAARLRATVETVKGELAHLRNENEKEKETWQAALEALKMKLEIAESNCIRAEIEAAKMRSQLELEVSAKSRMLSARDAELLTVKEEMNRLKSEFSSYKVRAHALLQKKEAELEAAVDSDQIKALEEALKEAEKEITLAYAEKDRVQLELQNALANHEKELRERDSALNDAEQNIKSLEKRLESANLHLHSEKEAWEQSLQNLEESWRIRCEALKSQFEESSRQDVEKEFEELKQGYKRLKEEHNSFRDLADRMIEEKDTEISRLLDDNKNLRRSLESKPPAGQVGNTAVTQKQDSSNLNASNAEQQILILARQQAQREEQLAQSQRHIVALQEELEELERENRLHSQQQAMLKAELRDMERSQKREGVDMTYLKNVILKLLETGEVEALLPVVAMLLQFSPEEMQKCQQAYRSSTDGPPSPAGDSSGSARSLFSRFSFA
ncbi:protein GRIP-like isoform X1 [Cucurbita maxima]|uniref:Protein GRIP-like isoform X1 n=1 Tax=Cucurbita maxima TaxID=3661 RepID=A0A6J1KZA3_CUCMA|nr:protein GRIP-like isoform X1 [Cucurbita maxima]XP_023007647.1 protein GRIP-like isoform X1 [Cucurbita maxima]